MRILAILPGRVQALRLSACYVDCAGSNFIGDLKDPPYIVSVI